MSETALRNGSTFPDIFITLVYGNYRLNHHKEMQKYRNMWNQRRNNSRLEDYISLFINFIDHLNDKRSILPDEISNIETGLTLYPEIELDGIFYETMSEYFEARNDCRRALEYQKKYSRYLENNVFLEHADTAEFSVEVGKVNIDDKPSTKNSYHPGS